VPEAMPKPDVLQARVAAYKAILQEVLDSRPSGMRQRLAEVLGKNRSFISQISNPAYAVPIPVQHVERIMEICHFSPREKERFLAAYRKAHPRRLQILKEEPQRSHTITLPDLGSDARNRQLDGIVTAFAEQVARLLQDK